MRNLRTFSQEFKRQVVEELMSGESRPAQLCRRHNISPSLLYHWKKQYSLGKFNNEPIEEAALKYRIEKLERLVGRSVAITVPSDLRPNVLVLPVATWVTSLQELTLH